MAGLADCAFCRVASGEAPAHVVAATDHAVAFLDRAPVFAGHTLVVPREHHVTLGDLPVELLAEVMGLARSIARAVEAPPFGAHGSFVAMNNRISQSVAHLHVHVVPRHRKDGLRGFFWPRTRYADAAEADAVAARIRAGLDPDAGTIHPPSTPGPHR